MAAVIFWAAWGTRSVIPTLPKLPDSPGIGLVPTLVRVVTDLTSSLRSPSFRWLFGGMMNVYAVSGANAALDLYMFNYFWEIGSTGAMLVFLGYPIGGIIGAFFGPALYARFGKRAGLIFGVLGWAVFQTLPVVMRLLGAFPENGDTILLPLLVTMKALSGATVIQADIAVGHFSRLGDTDRVIVMALAAFETLHFVLAGFSPEAPPLVWGSDQDSILWQCDNRFAAHLIIKRCVGVFIYLVNTALIGHGAPS